MAGERRFLCDIRGCAEAEMEKYFTDFARRGIFVNNVLIMPHDLDSYYTFRAAGG